MIISQFNRFTGYKADQTSFRKYLLSFVGSAGRHVRREGPETVLQCAFDPLGLIVTQSGLEGPSAAPEVSTAIEETLFSTLSMW